MPEKTRLRPEDWGAAAMGPILSDPRLALIGFSRDLLTRTGLAARTGPSSVRKVTGGEIRSRFIDPGGRLGSGLSGLDSVGGSPGGVGIGALGNLGDLALALRQPRDPDPGDPPPAHLGPPP